MSSLGFFAAGMATAYLGQWLGMLFLQGQIARRQASPRPRRGSNPPPPGCKPAPPPSRPQKPPLGLKPRWLADEDRLREVADAITRYREAGLPVPAEWLLEYDDLGYKLQPVWEEEAGLAGGKRSQEEAQP